MSLPSGIDRADGKSGRIGTADPSGAITIASAAGAGTANVPIEEEPNSPEIERSLQCTIRHRFTMSWDEGLTQIQGLGRGLVRTDGSGNVTRLLSSRLNHEPGDLARLETVDESISFDIPPDEFDFSPVELSVNIMKYPRYYYALKGTTAAEEELNQHTIRALQQYMDDPSYPARNLIPEELSNSIGVLDGGVDPLTGTFYCKGTDIAKRAALEIIEKFWRNEETPYIVGCRLVWSTYFWRIPHVNWGGYVEDPVTEADPQLPDWFWFTEDGTSIISKLAAWNPQCYSNTGLNTGTVEMSWLRQADQLHYDRTWFKLDRIWLGCPIGYWDTDLYTRGPRPQVYTDYHMPNIDPMPDYNSV